MSDDLKFHLNRSLMVISGKIRYITNDLNYFKDKRSKEENKKSQELYDLIISKKEGVLIKKCSVLFVYYAQTRQIFKK